MSIEIRCPRGHYLKVKDSMAGKTGLCPFCKGQVYVYVPIPEKVENALSEDVILGLIGPSAPNDTNSSGINLEEPPPSENDKHAHSPPRKSCVKCNRDIPAKTHICPYCHTYIADISGF